MSAPQITDSKEILKDVKLKCKNLSITDIYDLQMYLKRIAVDKKKHIMFSTNKRTWIYGSLAQYVSSGLGYDITKNCNEVIYTFARYAFVAIIHEKIKEEDSTKMGWSVIGRAIKKTHATAIRSNKMSSLEIEMNNIEYILIHDKVSRLINEYLIKLSNDNNGESN